MNRMLIGLLVYIVAGSGLAESGCLTNSVTTGAKSKSHFYKLMNYYEEGNDREMNYLYARKYVSTVEAGVSITVEEVGTTLTKVVIDGDGKSLWIPTETLDCE